MKVRGVFAVLVLSAMTMFAQSATPAPDAQKPAEHAACKRDKDGKMECCKKDKDGKMTHKGECCKDGKCARDHKEATAKS